MNGDDRHAAYDVGSRSPVRPFRGEQAWTYVADVHDAARSIKATPAHVTFCGHINRPTLHCMSATAKMTAFTPTTGGAVQLLPGRRWLAVLGSPLLGFESGYFRSLKRRFGHGPEREVDGGDYRLLA